MWYIIGFFPTFWGYIVNSTIHFTCLTLCGFPPQYVWMIYFHNIINVERFAYCKDRERLLIEFFFHCTFHTYYSIRSMCSIIVNLRLSLLINRVRQFKKTHSCRIFRLYMNIESEVLNRLFLEIPPGKVRYDDIFRSWSLPLIWLRR